MISGPLGALRHFENRDLLRPMLGGLTGVADYWSSTDYIKLSLLFYHLFDVSFFQERTFQTFL